jgi:hypothetical protein
MEIELTKDDFLQLQLYRASKSKNYKRQRGLHGLIFMACIIILGIVLHYEIHKLNYLIVSVIVGVIILLLYPIYIKKVYTKHYSKFIDDNYQERIGIRINIEFNDNMLISSDNVSESSIKVSGITNIVEIKTNYIINLDGVSFFVLPKSEEVGEMINKLVEKGNINKIEENDWKW